MDFDAEHRLLAAAVDDLPALRIAQRASVALAVVIGGTHIPPEDPRSPAYYVRSATLVLSVIGFRTARACMLVVAAGYWPEAHALKRRLSEVHARAQAVADDTSGQHAREWLAGKGPSTPPKIVAKFGSADLWALYGWGAHADARSVHEWLSEPAPDVHEAHRLLKPGPGHDPRLSNALLVEIAMECRDLAMAQAVARSRTRAEMERLHAGIRVLDSEIDEAVETYYAPEAVPED